MVKSCRKTRSKRVTCHKRYKILKKIREHHRKVRREQKKNPKLFKRKDPGVPNSLPFKEKLLEHIKATKKFESERRLALLQNAKNKEDAPKQPKKKTANVGFSKQFAHVLNKADVILEVLDSRDPLGTRCPDAERAVLAAGKKLVMLLNKIDLIPPQVLRQWLDYLRKWYTTMPFKANIQEQSDRLGNIKGKIPPNVTSVKGGLGVDGLMVLLGNICRHNGGSLTVGLIGLPNTGKSAVINTLVCRKVAQSSCVPGLTRQCHLYKIDKKISLIDTPGIVLSKSIDPCELVLRNCVKPESIDAPESAVSAILSWCPKRQIMVQYSIGEYVSTVDFLCKLAHRLGRLRKGGAPDITGSARRLLSDWVTGKLAHYTLPPTSGAQIAEPEKPPIIAFEEADLPLGELDSTVFKKMPQPRMDEEFCPLAVADPSQPLKTDLDWSLENEDDLMSEDNEKLDSDDEYKSTEEVDASMDIE